MNNYIKVTVGVSSSLLSELVSQLPPLRPFALLSIQFLKCSIQPLRFFLFINITHLIKQPMV